MSGEDPSGSSNESFADMLARARAIADSMKDAPAPEPPQEVAPLPAEALAYVQEQGFSGASSAGQSDSGRNTGFSDAPPNHPSPARTAHFEDRRTDDLPRSGRGDRRQDHDFSDQHARFGLGANERSGTHFSDREPDVSREIMVPKDVVGLVIGRSGATLKKIEQDTSTRLQVQRDETGLEQQIAVSIVGPSRGVARAEEMVQRAIAKQPLEDEVQETINIPTGKVGGVIGRGGETIRELQSRSGAKIQITPDHMCDKFAAERPVVITGSAAAVKEARRLIEDQIGDRGYGGGHGVERSTYGARQGSSRSTPYGPPGRSSYGHSGGGSSSAYGPPGRSSYGSSGGSSSYGPPGGSRGGSGSGSQYGSQSHMAYQQHPPQSQEYSQTQQQYSQQAQQQYAQQYAQYAQQYAQYAQYAQQYAQQYGNQNPQAPQQPPPPSS